MLLRAILCGGVWNGFLRHTPHTTPPPDKAQTGDRLFRVSFHCSFSGRHALHGEHAAGAAMRRRQRRLRSWLRHERMTVAMTLAEMTHHAAPRGPKMARVGDVEEQVSHAGLRAQKTPPPGERPGILPEPLPQRSDRSRRHFSEDGLPQLAMPSLAGVRQARLWTLQRSPSSSLSRWRRRSTRTGRRERRRRRRPSRRGRCAARGSGMSSWP